MEFKKTLTTDSGAAVTDNQNSRTAGPGGPILLEDHHLIEKLAHFDRERIPERSCMPKARVLTVISRCWPT